MFEQEAEKKDSKLSLQTDEILPSVAAYTDETNQYGHKSSQARQIIDYSETSQRPASQQQSEAKKERQSSSTVYQVSQQLIVTDRNSSQHNIGDKRQRNSHEFLIEPDQHMQQRETGDEEGGLETLKPSQKEDASLEGGSGSESQIFIEKLDEQVWKRKGELISFEEHHQEAANLIKGTAKMAEPADLVPNQFDLQNLIAEQSYERQGMAVMSFEQEASSAKQLIKADMRFLDNQQRQQYLRQQLKSQGVGQCRRQTFFNGRHSSLVSGQESSSIYHESVPLNKSIQHRASSTNNGGKFNSLQVPQHLVEKADRCQTRDGTLNKRSSNLNKSVFAKQANATHHFFNQRKNNKKQRSSQQLAVGSSTDEFHQSINNNSQTATGTDYEGDYVLIGKDKVDVISGNRRSQAATMDSYSHKRSSRQTSSSLQQNGGAQGLTYPHVPFKTKVAQKSKLQQRQAMKSQKSKEYTVMAPFHQDQSDQMRYFDENSAKELLIASSVPVKTKYAAGSTRQFNKSQMKQSITHLDQQSQMDSELSSNRLPLNRFNAAHEITVKPVPIYDSLNKTNVNFPSQQKSHQTLQSGITDFVSSGVLVKTKKDGPEQMIVKQAERDLLKLKEKLLQQALDKERRRVSPDANEQQKINDLDFNEGIQNLKCLGQCFWRFVEVEPILTTVLNQFENLMEKKRVQLSHYVRQVQGQFVLISDRIAEQKVQFEKVSEHLNRQEAFRKKVFNRENSEVMGLIAEYETLEKIGEHDKFEFDDYSGLTTDLEYIQRQLENAQLNLDTLVVFADRDQPMNLNVINDMKVEKELRVRDIQRMTAQRVVKRYYVNKDNNKHVEVQTDADQISMFKDFFENQVDAMMDRELSLQKDLENQVHRYSMQQNKIELFERKIEELKEKVEQRDETIDEFAIKNKVVDEELTSKAKEIRDKQIAVNDLKNQLQVKEKQAMQRIKEIQEAKDYQKKSENRKRAIEQEMSELQEELQKTVALGGDWSGLLDEANGKVEETQKEVDRLKDILKAREEALKAAEKREKVLKSQKQTVAVNRRSNKNSDLSGQSEGESPGMKPASSQLASRKRSDSITAGERTVLTSKKTSNVQSDKTIKEEKSDRQSSEHLKSVFKGEKSVETVINIVTKKQPIKAGKNVNAKIVDGKCSNCEACINVEDKEVTKQKKEEVLLQKFEQLLLGRQSKVFGNVIKDVTNRIERIQKTENNQSLSAHSNHTRSQERSQENQTSVNAYVDVMQTPQNLSPMLQPRHDFNLQINHIPKTAASPIAQPATSTPGAKQVISREIPQGTQQQQHESPEKVNKIVAFQNTSLNSPEQNSPMQPKKNNSASPYRNMLNMTKQMSKNMNYRFALEDSELSKRKEQIKNKKRSTGVNSNASRSPDFNRGSFRDSTVALSKSQQRSKAAFDLYPSFDQLRDSTVTREIATQTKYDPEDVQRIFIARIEQVLGMKGYRPVSTYGQPKLSVEGMHAQATRVATSQSAYRITWNKNSQVKNVANVEKMRKFEPIRRKGRDKQDSVNPREKSDSHVTGVDESMQASFYTQPQQRQGLLTQNRGRDQIVSGSMVQGQTFESRLDEQRLQPRAYGEVVDSNTQDGQGDSQASLKMQIRSFREHEKVLDNIVTQGDSRMNSVESRKDTKN